MRQIDEDAKAINAELRSLESRQNMPSTSLELRASGCAPT